MPISVPRVDYLLHNGGLPRNVPRTLLAVDRPTTTYQSLAYPQHNFPRPSGQAIAEIDKLFAPYHALLNDYETVVSKNGSLAVATGYRSVARKLLDRLENIFARDISCEVCSCVICRERGEVSRESDVGEALGWGEILEWVSGRRDTPVWPAFDFGKMGDPTKLSQETGGLGISVAESPSKHAPMDADVPEEFREHYVRQSKKTKQTVDRWLTSQPAHPSTPPPEVDDETLTFAILTYLDPPSRPIFTALLSSGASEPPTPASRAPTPSRPRSELMVKSSLALQRLYRLPTPPRDPETAIFLLRHPHLHRLLATLANINTAEWDVLTSGRFDGFLWSGAEDPSSTGTTTPQMSRHPTPAPNRPPSSISRSTTPFSRGPSRPSAVGTPFAHLASHAASRDTTSPQSPGPPVPHDEETEIAVLAEVEREIYVGMEALEDAFEALHRKAEAVRQALRERGAGLSMAGQARRHALGFHGGVEVVHGTPGPGPTFGGGDYWESESEGGGGAGQNGDAASELWPDDSASNVSSSRHRRPKRRNERRTPALVEEESEDD